jgi:Domain of unknown function (DUF4160)
MAPTVFRDGAFRFFFFSREESRVHVHVSHTDGEAKFWLKPQIEIALNQGLNAQQIKAVTILIEQREEEILNAWSRHFGS